LTRKTWILGLIAAGVLLAATSAAISLNPLP
jgi:hypothetical protein